MPFRERVGRTFLNHQGTKTPRFRTLDSLWRLSAPLPWCLGVLGGSNLFVPAGSAPRRESCDVAHLAAGERALLAVEMQLGVGLGERVAPLLDVAADQVLHDGVGVPLG